MKFELTHTITINQTFNISDAIAEMMHKDDLHDHVQKHAEDDMQDLKTVVNLINNNESLKAILDLSLSVREVE